MSVAKRTILITGAGGFAGRHLITEVSSETDWEIVGLSLRGRPIAGRATMLACDLLDRSLVDRTIARWKPDVVVHLAAETYVPKSFASPGDTIVNNVLAQLNVLEACRSAGLDATILVVGSSEEYGQVSAEDLPITEEQPFRPANPYAVSKIAQDMLGLQYALAHQMKVIRLRPFNHFGPGQSDRFVISNFARQVAEAELGRIEPVILTGDLSVERDFLDVRDVARAYRLSIDRLEPGEVYNIASGTARRIEDLLNTLISYSTIRVDVRRDPARMRVSDTPRVIGDASKFSSATGWFPAIPFETSLIDTLNDWRAVLGSVVNADPIG